MIRPGESLNKPSIRSACRKGRHLVVQFCSVNNSTFINSQLDRKCLNLGVHRLELVTLRVPGTTDDGVGYSFMHACHLLIMQLSVEHFRFIYSMLYT